MITIVKSAPRNFALTHRIDLTVPVAGARQIFDLTPRPRIGLRGPGTRGWCSANGIPFPEAVNTLADRNDLVVARLGQCEILVWPKMKLLYPGGTLPANVHDGYRDEGWFWFRIEGSDSRGSLGSLTSVDLRPHKAPAGTVLQTRLAGLDAVLLIRCESDGEKIDVFGDIASSDYLMDVFSDRCPDWGDVE